MVVSAFNHERLRALYESSGKTYEDISSETELPIKNIWRYLGGQGDPNTGAVAALARCFVVSTDYLLGLTDDPRPLAVASKLEPVESELLAAWRRNDVYSLLKIILENRPA